MFQPDYLKTYFFLSFKDIKPMEYTIHNVTTALHQMNDDTNKVYEKISDNYDTN